jgi:lipopolysaccharide export system protein LptA
MRLSVERLRWVLIAGAVLLVAVVAGYVGYGRYVALKRWKDMVARSGARITREANGYTYSQSFKGKTLFTVHAAKALQRGDGTWELHDGELTLYSRTSDRVDHIYGAEFEYDPKQEVARAMGEVHMDLQAPEALGPPSTPPQLIRGKEGRAPSAPHEAGDSTQTIHVRTSGLVYVRSLGVAATQQDVEFRYGEIEAHSRGAEFDEASSTVHLLADVTLHGKVHGSPLDMTATKADLDRSNELVSLASPMMVSNGRRMRSERATAKLRKDGSVNALYASGQVTLSEGTETVRGDALEAALNAKSSPETAVMTGNVTLDDSDAAKPMHAQAKRVDAAFNARGDLASLVGSGGVVMAAKDKGPAADWLGRSLRGDSVQVAFSAGDKGAQVVRQMHAVGHASASGDQDVMTVAKKGAQPALAGRKTTSLDADDLVATFAQDAGGKASQVQRVQGTGHARLLQVGLAGARTESTANAVDMMFAPAVAGGAGSAGGSLALRSATETGAVTMRSQAAAKKGKAGAVTTANAQAAEFDGAAETLMLHGDARFAQAGVETTAASMKLMQNTGDAEAYGHVVTTLAGRESSHVLADHATFAHAADTAVFFGTDAAPAKLWQGASQVMAAEIAMDGTQATLIARPASAMGFVTAVFVAPEAAKSAKDAKAAKPEQPRAVHVVSRQLAYLDKTREAIFTDDVAMQTADGDVRAQRAVVFLTAKPVAKAGAVAGNKLPAANPTGGQLDRVVATGHVRMQEPGRSGSGEQLVYTAASGQFVLTGTAAAPPRVVDAEQGNVTGAMLVFGSRDNTVVVSGDGGTHRVRTETEVKPQP